MIKDLSNQLNSFGLCEPRSYYIPFVKGQKDSCRNDSKAFISLVGDWKIAEYNKITDIPDNFFELTPQSTIAVPSCVQYYGYDHFQYVNIRYPIPYTPPDVPKNNPTYHYQREFEIKKAEKEYLIFEGVDSCF